MQRYYASLLADSMHDFESRQIPLLVLQEASVVHRGPVVVPTAIAEREKLDSRSRLTLAVTRYETIERLNAFTDGVDHLLVDVNWT